MRTWDQAGQSRSSCSGSGGRLDGWNRILEILSDAQLGSWFFNILELFLQILFFVFLLFFAILFFVFFTQ